MCGLCGVLSSAPHFTEAGTDAARVGPGGDPHDRHLARAHRIELINAMLRPVAITVSDWSGSKYVVKGASGKTRLVDQLPQLWAALDEVADRPIDPLDRDYIAALAAVRPVKQG